MFTGIIQKTAHIQSVEMRSKNLYVLVEKPAGWRLTKGQSIAVEGICLTVTTLTPKTFGAELMPETLKKTTGASFTKGTLVNLERALKLSDLLDGHLIQGHVDGCGQVVRIQKQGTSQLLTMAVSKPLTKQIALHGSVAINGASLTVAKQKGNELTVALIPYTLSHTNLGLLKKGDYVNVETDFLARHHSVRNYATVAHNAARGIRKSAGNKRRLKA